MRQEYDDIVAASKVAAEVILLPFASMMADSFSTSCCRGTSPHSLQPGAAEGAFAGATVSSVLHLAAGEEPLEDDLLAQICS